MEELYDITAIEKGLQGVMSMMPNGSMKVLSVVVDDSVKRLHEPMQLAIIGKISSSKSTLVNAILGKQEIMSTGQKEVTYNVGWLKYGDPDSDIIIHHKDGSPNSVKKRDEFAKWTTEEHSSETNNISYIELFDDAEILKDINIIDTPGLDALRGKDSQNTLDFIREVHPDAVIMLFTHAVSESVLSVVSKFNMGTTFNPLNAIGVLSKIDVLWQEDFERKKSALEIGQRMVANRICKDEMIRKTLFNIYPISALLFLSASCFNETLLQYIRCISTSDEEAKRKAMKSVVNFLNEDNDIQLDLAQRKKLIESVGLYGIYIILDMLQENANIGIVEIRERLKKECGAVDFMKVLHNHFGARARLIKLESIFQNIQMALRKERILSNDQLKTLLISKVQKKISNLFSSLVYEHNEYDLLYRIYNNEIDMEPAVKSEFIRLCGENGESAPERLDVPIGTPSAELQRIAQEKENQWKRNVALEPDPEERLWMMIILKSYKRLSKKIRMMCYQFEQAQAFLYNK